MDSAQFASFVSSADTLRVYRDNQIIFASQQDSLLPLLEYLGAPGFVRQPVVIFDKVMGNAAALLAVIAGAREVFSPLGSQPAVATLEKYKIKYNLTEVVPYITRPDGAGICPMEKLSLGKDPEEFYRELKALTRRNT